MRSLGRTVLVDSSRLGPQSVLSSDVCIIGAGAAGITLALRLRSSGLDVLLLEAGHFEPDAASQKMYQAEFDGPFAEKYPRYPSQSRLRYFGGTTNHWAGWCRRLDPISMEERPWLGIGWPFGREELDPHYGAAETLVGIKGFRPPEAWRGSSREPLEFGSDSPLRTRVFNFSKPLRFGKAYRKPLVDAATIRVVLGCAVLALHTDADGRHVSHADLDVDGRRCTVRSRAFVLAAGGLENPRLLLASDSEVPSGIGNQNDLVGRWFMDHPGILGMHAVFAGAPAQGDAMRLYRRQEVDEVVAGPTQAVVGLKDEVQRREQVLNGCFLLRKRGADTSLVAGVAAVAGGLGRAPTLSLQPSFTSEPMPTEHSRVTLTDERDRLGVRKIRLDWRLHPDFDQHLRRTAEVFARGIARAGLGRVDIGAMQHTAPPRGMSAGHHHIGTTRMHTDPKRGVVDAQCRVHGTDNLYVAGSSVFPTAGFANPTLTIVALAVRMAKRLAVELA